MPRRLRRRSELFQVWRLPEGASGLPEEPFAPPEIAGGFAQAESLSHSEFHFWALGCLRVLRRHQASTGDPERGLADLESGVVFHWPWVGPFGVSISPEPEADVRRSAV